MKLRMVVVAFSLPLLAAALVVTTAFAGERGSQRTERLRGVNFVSVCTFSHSAPDDPILFFGVPGASHDHSFVGNTSTNASSTLESLLATATTCHRPGDTAAYWIPTLLDNGRPVMPVRAQIYYRRVTQRRVEAFPPGFRMIAGDAKATSPQGRRVTFWSCGVLGGVAPASDVPSCPNARRAGLRLHVRFPSCWDGKSLDSGDHQGHVAYPVRGRCPSRFAHALPQITLIYRYPITGGPNVTLASGGRFSGHADFFNAWRQSDLQALVDGCLNALRHCARGS
jgi:Domain of unknown function (DUF1996)